MEITTGHTDAGHAHTMTDHAPDSSASWITGVLDWVKSLDYLSISIGFIYLWFGALKFFPTISPAETLATNTVVALTGGLMHAEVAIISLAIMEVGIGVGLIFLNGRKFWLRLAIFHMVCTFTPLFLFPDLSFGSEPFQLTLVGQRGARPAICGDLRSRSSWRKGSR